MSTQIYDIQFELNEVEAGENRYPSTISFLNLLNALNAKETDTCDRGRRFVGIFRFVYDHVFGPFTKRAYSDPSEKWKLVMACQQYFQMLPPLSTKPDRCEWTFVGNAIGQENGVYDKSIDLQFCDYTNEKLNLKGKYLAVALML